jgi:hypothetical protein
MSYVMRTTAIPRECHTPGGGNKYVVELLYARTGDERDCDGMRYSAIEFDIGALSMVSA